MLFLFTSCCFNNFFIIPIDIENVRLKLVLAIPTGAPIIVANNAIEMIPLACCR